MQASQKRSHHQLSRHKLSLLASVLALALGSSPAWSQYGGTGPAGSGSPGSGAGTSSGTAASSLTEEDREMIKDLAEANIAEIDTGRLALSKTQNPRVREYAQKMIDDHGSAQQELQQMAQAKGMTLPQETDLAHRTVSGALRLLSGDTFDSQYINRVGIDDHQRTVELLQKAQGQARDTELRALAGRMLPVVQGHLDVARQISQQRDQREQQQERQQQGSGAAGQRSGGTSGSTGSGMR